MNATRKLTHAVVALALIVALLGSTLLVYADATLEWSTGDATTSSITVGETATFGFTITNTSATETAASVSFVETDIFAYVELVADSVKVNGESVSYTYSEGKLSITLSEILAGETRVITYDAVVVTAGSFNRGGTLNRALWGSVTVITVNPAPTTYLVVYDPNGGTGTTYSVTENVGDSHTVLANSDSHLGFSRNDYAFYGWSTSSTATIPDVPTGTSIGDEAENSDTITLYAVWIEVGPDVAYIVAYDANGGTGSYADTDLEANSSYTVKGQSDTGITYAGHTLTAWNTKADGSGISYAAGSTFTITANMTLYAQWEQLLNTEDHFAYICGYPDGSVRIDNYITRGEAASIFYRLLNRQGTAFGNWFSDVADSDWCATQVNYLASLGILSGYPDGTYRPNEQITRAEFAAIASKFDSLSATSTNVFPDVPSNHWAVGMINSAYAKGWVTGYPDGTFRPDEQITRAEVVSIVNKMLSREIGSYSLGEVENPYNDIDVSHWAYANVIEASYSHEYARNSDSTELWNDFHWQ